MGRLLPFYFAVLRDFRACQSVFILFVMLGYS